jgi:hypothetical protein
LTNAERNALTIEHHQRGGVAVNHLVSSGSSRQNTRAGVQRSASGETTR